MTESSAEDEPPEVTVTLPRILVDVAGGPTAEVVAAATVAGAVEAVIDRRPRLRHHLLDEAGELRRNVRFAHNGTILVGDLDVALAAGDTVAVLHSVSGG